MQAGEALRWQPLTAVFLLASAWWVKWPLFAAIGAARDIASRRLLPVAGLAALAAAALAGLAVSVLKDAAGRPRPPLGDSGIQALGSIPDSTSFPSGHAATAFAAAVAVGLVCRRLRTPLLALAAAVALSRVYLGVHYWSDVLAGSLLGALIGLATGWTVRWARRPPRSPSPSPATP